MKITAPGPHNVPVILLLLAFQTLALDRDSGLLVDSLPPDTVRISQPGTNSQEPTAIKWRWAKGDSWKTTARMSDKVEHFVGGYLGTLPLLVIGDASGWPWLSDEVVVSSVAGMAFLWEVKDAYYNPENFPSEREKARPYHFVGDGFSWRDMVASWAGVAAAYGTIMLARYLAKRREQ